MSVIRVVSGRGAGPTELAAYDAALADAGVHNYNLVTLSSVVPAGPTIEVVGEAPDLGPAGSELHVVESSITVPAGESGAAGIGWVRSESGRGVFYEVDGPDEEAVAAEIEDGLAAAVDLREWTFREEPTVIVEAVDAGAASGASREADASSDGDDPREYGAAVVCAAFGEGRPAI